MSIKCKSLFHGIGGFVLMFLSVMLNAEEEGNLIPGFHASPTVKEPTIKAEFLLLASTLRFNEKYDGSISKYMEDFFSSEKIKDELERLSVWGEIVSAILDPEPGTRLGNDQRQIVNQFFFCSPVTNLNKISQNWDQSKIKAFADVEVSACLSAVDKLNPNFDSYCCFLILNSISEHAILNVSDAVFDKYVLSVDSFIKRSNVEENNKAAESLAVYFKKIRQKLSKEVPLQNPLLTEYSLKIQNEIRETGLTTQSYIANFYLIDGENMKRRGMMIKSDEETRKFLKEQAEHFKKIHHLLYLNSINWTP